MSNEEIRQEAEKLQTATTMAFLKNAALTPEWCVAFLTSFAARVRNEAIEECASALTTRRRYATRFDKLRADSIRSLKSQEATDGK